MRNRPLLLLHSRSRSGGRVRGRKNWAQAQSDPILVSPGAKPLVEGVEEGDLKRDVLKK